MNVIQINELEEKIIAGESIEKLAREYSVCFYADTEYIPRRISVDKLIEIIEKAPELFLFVGPVPVWLFLLLLVREKFDLIDKIVSKIFKREKRISRYRKEEDTSNIIVRTTINTINQVTKEQISELLSILEKRKDLLHFNLFKDFAAKYLFYYFIKPFKDYLSEEHFLSIFDWASRVAHPYFFKHISFDFFEQLPVDSQFIQEKLIDYFISAHPSWLINPPYRKFDLFKRKEKLVVLNEEFFVSSVAKSYSKLHGFKRVYLLNFPLFIEKYPQLAIKSLKAFINNFNSKDFIIRDNKIPIPNGIWDILIKKDPLLFLDLFKKLSIKVFSFDINYILDKAELLRFLYPESAAKVQERLKKFKEVFSRELVCK